MNWLTNLICSWFHGGGKIKRNSAGEIDWQCCKCGRWSGGIPVADEDYLVSKGLK